MKPQNNKESDYVIKWMSLGHCARGPLRCEKCKEAEKLKKFYLLRADYEPSEYARPIIEIIKDGKRNFVGYVVIQGFKTQKKLKNMQISRDSIF
ncbi:MAG: hypothetical protein HWN67_07820 [Candidatus Helarchaeota archaeon]|nr:hypothetical protein [Candidatus Helarchaeota archaeon]